MDTIPNRLSTMTPQDPSKLRYTGEAGRQYHQTKRSVPPIAYDWIARLRAEKFANHVKPSNVVFEYGVGFGWNLAALQCAKRIGFDVTESLRPTVERQGIEFISDPGELASDSVDVAICHHTLEHVFQPPVILAEIRRLLRPQGTLLLFVPYEKEARYRRYNPAEPNHHLYSWNVQTLANLVTECDFRVLEANIHPFRFDRFAARLAARLKVGESGFRLIRSAALLLQPEHEVRLITKKP